jgi:hypothetical protein
MESGQRGGLRRGRVEWAEQLLAECEQGPPGQDLPIEQDRRASILLPASRRSCPFKIVQGHDDQDLNAARRIEPSLSHH